MNGVVIVSVNRVYFFFFIVLFTTFIRKQINIYYLIFLSKLEPEFHRGKSYYKFTVGVILACIFYEYRESYNRLGFSPEFPSNVCGPVLASEHNSEVSVFC